jgi:hypothetical protein
LNDVIKPTKREDIKIKAISALHSIEMDIFNLWKQLPELDIAEKAKQLEQEKEQQEQEREPQPPAPGEWV